MTLRSKVWLAVAVLFTLVNLAGIGVAAMAGEVRHTAAHVALTVLGAYWVPRVWRGSPPAPAEPAAPPTEAKPPKSAPSDERDER